MEWGMRVLHRGAVSIFLRYADDEEEYCWIVKSGFQYSTLVSVSELE